MKRFILVAGFVLALNVVGQSQVTVSQGFVDDASKAFKEVVVLRAAVDAQKRLIADLDLLIAAQERSAGAKDLVIRSQTEEISLLRQLKCEQTSYFFGLIKKKKCK